MKENKKTDTSKTEKPVKKSPEELEKEFQQACQTAITSNKTRVEFYLPENVDCAGECLERRIHAVSNYADYVQERFASKYPLMDVVREFLEINVPYSNVSYDKLSNHQHIVYAAALFILDTLAETKGLREAIKYFPDNMALLDEITLPDFKDSVHDDLMIKAVLSLILHRNDQPDRETFYGERMLVTDAVAGYSGQRNYQRTQEASTGRERFDAVMSLIPEEARKRAAERFIEKEWEALDKYFSTINISRELQHKWKKDMTDTENEMLRRSLYNKIEQLDVDISVFQLASVVSEMPFERYLEAIDKKLGTEVTDVRFLEVQNPYETVFALLLLLDSGSDMPWLYNQGLMVVNAAIRKLPWGLKLGRPNEREFQGYGENLDETMEETKIEGELEDPNTFAGTDYFCWSNPEAVPEDYLNRMNYSQLLFECTGSPIVLPRKIFDRKILANILKDSYVGEANADILSWFLTTKDSKTFFRNKEDWKDCFVAEEAYKMIVQAKKGKQGKGKKELVQEIKDLKVENARLREQIKDLKTLLNESANGQKTS